MRPLEPVALKDLREELAPHLKPFRLAMLKLARELNAAICAGAAPAEVQKEAKFLVQTDVYPRLSEMDAVVQNPTKHRYRRAADLARSAPELATNFAAMPVHIALAKSLAKIVGVLADVRDEQVSTQDQIATLFPILTRSKVLYLSRDEARGFARCISKIRKQRGNLLYGHASSVIWSRHISTMEGEE